MSYHLNLQIKNKTHVKASNKKTLPSRPYKLFEYHHGFVSLGHPSHPHIVTNVSSSRQWSCRKRPLPWPRILKIVKKCGYINHETYIYMYIYICIIHFREWDFLIHSKWGFFWYFFENHKIAAKRILMKIHRFNCYERCGFAEKKWDVCFNPLAAWKVRG